MRAILHPGPVAPERIHVQSTRVRHQRWTLAPGASLLQRLSEALHARGAESAVLQLAGGGFAPLGYVMPATSRTPEHAVYFSERFEADAPVRLQQACVTLGRKAGGPWLHCHARWVDAAGRPQCGHLLPDEAQIAEPIHADAWLLDGAAFEVGPDAETRFSLFWPVSRPARHAEAGQPALALRLAPNVDVCEALAAVCREHGIRRATLRGGVGSTVGAVFADGRRVEPHITESFIERGGVDTDAQGRRQVTLDIAMVDHHGGQHRGRLAPGENPVLVTFELLLVPD